jgi:GNAT superfamily N-acetyltransferase
MAGYLPNGVLYDATGNRTRQPTCSWSVRSLAFVLRNTGRVDICVAGQADLAELARLLWLNAGPDERAKQSVEAFAVDLAAWWKDHDDSHLAFVARLAESEVVGMAWLAVVSRPPRPGVIGRRSADIQSVFVVPEERGKGIGSALVKAAVAQALHCGAGWVTVHSGRKAVPVYERLGFASSRQLLQKAPAYGAVPPPPDPAS